MSYIVDCMYISVYFVQIMHGFKIHTALVSKTRGVCMLCRLRVAIIKLRLKMPGQLPASYFTKTHQIKLEINCRLSMTDPRFNQCVCMDLGVQFDLSS